MNPNFKIHPQLVSVKSDSVIKTLRIMNITAILLLIFCLHVSAGVSSQSVTLNIKNAPLNKVFEEIKRQTDYTFVYTEGILYNSKTVNVDLKNAKLEDALNSCLENQPFTYTIINKTVVLIPRENVPYKTISNTGQLDVPLPIVIHGRVANEKGEPLANVSVSIVGTQVGTTTDSKGLFTITTSDRINTVLEISSIGFQKQRVKVGKQVEINVTLKTEVSGLNEVVVVAYGTQKKTNVLSAISTVTGKELLSSPTANITNALAGRLPGLVSVQASGDPGRDQASLLIRGQSTLNGTAPLVIVDGVERDFSGIDANEVESISMLKDASATAVYGIRGANGVILVTTKRGKAGKTVVSFTANNSFQKITNYPQGLGAYEYAVLKNEGYTNENPTSPKFQYDSTTLLAYREHTDPYLYPDVNYKTTYLKNSALMGGYNLNVSGGNNFVKYFVSGSLLSQGGLFKTFPNGYFNESLSYTKYNFRSNLDFNLSPSTVLSVNMGILNDLRKGPYTDQSNGDAIGAIFGSIMRVPPVAMPIVNPDGSFSYPSNRVDPDVAGIANNNVYALLTYSGIKKDYSNLIDGSLILTQKLDKIILGLRFSANGSMSSGYKQTTGIFRAPLSGGGNPPSNFFARYKILGKNSDGTYIYSPVIGVDNPAISSIESNALSTKRWYTEAKLDYAGHYKKHNYTALALVNASRNFVYPAPPAATIWPSSYFGMVGRATYNYDDKYLTEFNLGYNGSENFAKGKRMGLFPSYSVGWILSKEHFLENSKIVSFLKLRATYGKTGNDQITGSRFLFFDNPYTQSGSYSFGLNNGNTVAGYNEGVQGNHNVTWEVANKYNLGLESRFWGSLLGINVDVFYEKRNSILIALGTVPSVYGQTVPAGNLGIVENKGYEIELTHENHIGKVQYSIRANLAYAHNTILFRDEPNQVYPYLARTGRSIGQNWGLQVLGLFRSQGQVDDWYAQGNSTTYSDKTVDGKLRPGDFIYKDQNGDKVIDANDMIPVGKPSTPEYNMGLNLSASYAGFDVNALLQGSTSVSMSTVDEISWAFFNAGNANQYIYDHRWTPATAETANYPRVSSSPTSNDYNYVSNSYWLLNASYLRVKQLQLGYTFSNVIMSRLHLKALRIYIGGYDLFTWSGVTKWNLDPENRNSRAFYYPQQKVFNMGVNLTF